MSNLNKNELASKVKDMRETSEDLRQKIQRSQDECDDVQSEYVDIQEMVRDMTSQFLDAKFSTRVASHMEYDNNTTFTENNIT